MNTDKLRQLYIDFFKAKAHTYFSSDSLVPESDPTLLFTGAGMNQFKPYFLGDKKDVKRAVSCQKCIRTGDLDNVGETDFHHTFFEMLGNFSFGDYFKEESIAFAWEFITKELGLKPQNLWVSVFVEDNEAYDIWKKKIKIDESRIVRYGADDNYWPANAPEDGPNGPCGPCSEIYYGPTAGEGVEIWNLVFTEFDRKDVGILTPLPQRNIDTGMGLERLASVMQGVKSNFDTDNFVALAALIHGTDPELGFENAPTKSRNVIMDHLRAIVFSLADGVIPDKEGRGYVIRKLIRRSALQLSVLGRTEPSLYRYVKHVVHVMGDAYPELSEHVSSIESVMKREEEAVWSIIEHRVPEVRVKIKKIALTTRVGQEDHSNKIATELAYEYYDTYGVPREVLESLLAENNLTFEADHFDQLMETQRQRSRFSSKISGSIFSSNSSGVDSSLPNSKFVGYETTKSEGKVLALYTKSDDALIECKKLEKGQEGLLIVDNTPFYAESGGQVGDTGIVVKGSLKATVTDTQRISDQIGHSIIVTDGQVQTGDSVDLVVDAPRQENIKKNHTATHLLHSALRQILGDHVKQRGSLVAEDRLRFDFSHFSQVTTKELRIVEELVNSQIRAGLDVTTNIKSAKDAFASGAMAFFGEKYGEEVRVVEAGGFSNELCGGIHVVNTQDIELFRIVSESSIQSGVRRIEAVTSQIALNRDKASAEELTLFCNYLQSTESSIMQSCSNANDALGDIQKKLKSALQKKIKQEAKKIVESSPLHKGTRLVIWECVGLPAQMLRELADAIRVLESAIVIAISVIDSKPQLVVAVSKTLASLPIHAGDIVKQMSTSWGGSGGGRPDMAMGGGKANSDTHEAMKNTRTKIMSLLESQ